MNETKRCYRCKSELQLTEFNRDSSRVDGLMNKCKTCHREQRRTGNSTGRPAILKERPHGKKQCRICGDLKEESEFSPMAAASDGLDSRCIKCNSIRMARRKGAYRSVERRGKRFEEYIGKLVSAHKGQAKFDGNSERRKRLYEESEVTKELLLDLWRSQQGKCALTGVRMTKKRGEGKVPTNISIDRVDPMKGYTKDNIHLVCYQVNVMKHDLKTSDLEFWCRAVLENNKR